MGGRIPLPIETERLLIRDFDPARDGEAMLSVYGDREVMRFIPGGALAGLEPVRRRLEKYRHASTATGLSSWAVELRDTGRVIGDAGFGIFEPTGDVELGYTLARDAWGHGYATEAAGACLTTGLTHIDVPRIIALVAEENDASIRVAERIGMTRAGRVEAHGRPHLMFEATRP